MSSFAHKKVSLVLMLMEFEGPFLFKDAFFFVFVCQFLCVYRRKLKSVVCGCVTPVVLLTLEVLYPLTSNTRILKEIVNKGSSLFLVIQCSNVVNIVST